MSEMDSAQAMNFARQWGQFMRSFSKIGEIAEWAHTVEGRRAETEAAIAAGEARAAKINADADAAQAAKREEIATLEGQFNAKTGIIAKARAEAAEILSAANFAGGEILANARMTAIASVDDANAVIAGIQADAANERKKLDMVRMEVATATAERDGLNAEIDTIRSKARALAG